VHEAHEESHAKHPTFATKTSFELQEGWQVLCVDEHI